MAHHLHRDKAQCHHSEEETARAQRSGRSQIAELHRLPHHISTNSISHSQALLTLESPTVRHHQLLPLLPLRPQHWIGIMIASLQLDQSACASGKMTMLELR